MMPDLDFIPAVAPVASSLQKAIVQKIEKKTKAHGSLGVIEVLARRICTIQNTLTPHVHRPTVLVFAGDHGIVAEGVSSNPQSYTSDLVQHLLAGGSAVNVMTRAQQIDFRVVDAGVTSTLQSHPRLIDAKIGPGTKNFLRESAMSMEQCLSALKKGMKIISNLSERGCNTLGFGDVGVGNSSTSAILIHLLCGIPLEQCLTDMGLDDEGVQRKKEALTQAIRNYNGPRDPLALLTHFGGFETAMICGGILQGASLGRIVVVDGYGVAAALLVAEKLQPNVLDYIVFSHVAGDPAHQVLLDHLGVRPLLQLDMRLGEGTGAAMALPLVKLAASLTNEMATFPIHPTAAAHVAHPIS